MGGRRKAEGGGQSGRPTPRKDPRLEFDAARRAVLALERTA